MDDTGQFETCNDGSALTQPIISFCESNAPDGKHPLIERSELEQHKVYEGARPLILPREDWRAIEPETIFGSGDLKMKNSPRVGFFVVSPHLFANVQNIMKQHDHWNDQIDRIKKISTILKDYLKWRFPISDDIVDHGIAGVEPGLLTVTINSKTNRTMGVHLDSWDGISLAERRRARTRFSINLGPDVRYFMWVPRSFETMLAHLNCPLDDPAFIESPQSLQLLHDYVNASRNIPVIRMKLAPGDGYIADTDFLFHDGSSIDACQKSFHYTLRAHISKSPALVADQSRR